MAATTRFSAWEKSSFRNRKTQTAWRPSLDGTRKKAAPALANAILRIDNRGQRLKEIQEKAPCR
jgi:hypothetical protein